MITIIKSNVEAKKRSLLEQNFTTELLRHQQAQATGIYLKKFQTYSADRSDATTLFLFIFAGEGELKILSKDEQLTLHATTHDVISCGKQAGSYNITNVSDTELMAVELRIAHTI